MNSTTNYGLGKPLEDELYDIAVQNTNMDKIDTNLKSVSNTANSATSGLSTHISNKSNPHEVTKAQIGLGNVPNVSTNNQTPSYTVPSSLAALVSGEILQTAFGKIAKAVNDLISHLANKSNPHSVTKSQIGLGNVDNTSDANKPISTATQTALNGKLGSTANAVSASKLETARTVSLTGSVIGSGTFDGSANLSISTTTNHTHNYAGSSSAGGVATSASKLSTARTISLTGGVTGSGSFDGSANLSIAASVPKITQYEGYGQLGAPQEITAATNLNNFMTPGIYSFAESNTPTNAPDDAVNGWLIVLPWNKVTNVACKQIWIRHGTITGTNWKIYVRTRIDSTWGKWGEVVTDKSQIAHCYTLCDALIPENSNLNNFKSIGTYRATGTNIATTMANCPTQVNFRMDIEFTSSNNYICQKIIDRNAAVFTRVCDLTTNTWTAWKSL